MNKKFLIYYYSDRRLMWIISGGANPLNKLEVDKFWVSKSKWGLWSTKYKYEEVKDEQTIHGESTN